MKISVTYDIKDRPRDSVEQQRLDHKIIAALKQAGFRWYASGLSINTGVRDLAFDDSTGRYTYENREQNS